MTRISPAIPIAPITPSGSMPAFVVTGTVAGVEAIIGSGVVSASSGQVVVAVRILVCAALIGGTILTTYTDIACGPVMPPLPG